MINAPLALLDSSQTVLIHNAFQIQPIVQSPTLMMAQDQNVSITLSTAQLLSSMTDLEKHALITLLFALLGISMMVPIQNVFPIQSTVSLNFSMMDQARIVSITKQTVLPVFLMMLDQVIAFL